MQIKLKDFVQSAVTVATSGTAGTSLTVTPGDGVKYPALTAGQAFPIVVEAADGSAREAMLVTARTGDVFTVVRSAAPVAWTGSGQTVYLTLNEAAMTEMQTAGQQAVTPITPFSGINLQTLSDQMMALLRDLNIVAGGSGLTPPTSATSFLARLAALEASMTQAQTNIGLRGQTPIGTKSVFWQPTAPTGWVRDTVQHDRLLRVNSGAFVQDAGGGDWFTSGFTIGGTALSLSQIPPHTHTQLWKSTTGGSAAGGDPNSINTTTVNTGSTGGNGAGAAATHSHAISNDGNWRPKYLDIILCTRSS